MPSDSQNQQDCPTTIHPEGASQLVLVDLILGNRLILTESNPAAGILAGRSLQTDLPLQSPSASRNHCRLKNNEGGWQIEDLDSSNDSKDEDELSRRFINSRSYLSAHGSTK